MMKENFSNLRAETATDSITIYWERPEGCFGTQYQVFLGETLVGSTKKTHYTISELKADTPYKVTVKGVYELKTDSEQKIDNAKMRLIRYSSRQSRFRLQKELLP